MPDKLRSIPARPNRPAAIVPPSIVAETLAAFTRPKVAASIHPSSASATNPNRAKRKGARLPNAARTSVKRDGITRSGVTVIRVDPATLRRSTAGGRNTSERVIDGGTVIARNVLSRRTLKRVSNG